MAQTQKTTKFTPEEEKKIKEQIEAQKQADRQALIDAEARNRLFDEQRKQPGFKYY